VAISDPATARFTAIKTWARNLYTSNIGAIKWRMRWAEHVTRMGEMRNAYIILVGKAERKRPL
jgi:hypothetical protein